MSPEQSGADGAIDARTDLYTVGIVLFELLTGKKPFQSENIGELILMQRETLPPHVRDIVPELSPQIDAVVWKAMAKLPEDRYQSAGEMAAALEGTPEARGAGPPPGRPAARAAPPVEKRPARPADATTVDTISAVRRRVGGDAATKEGSEPVRQWRLAPVAGVFLVFVMVMLLIGRVIRHSGTDGSAAKGMAPPRAGEARLPEAAGSASPAAAAPDGQGLERARQLIASHATAEALALLDQLRATEPANADVPYLQALVYFDARRIQEAVAAAEVAIGKDPALKADPDLVKAALRSLASDRGYEKSEAFLRTLGPPAQPFIKDAAHRDPNPKVRDRAAELLTGGGGAFRSSSHGWSTRPSSGSGSSLFKR
jgi:serine/threonine-protein kinase